MNFAFSDIDPLDPVEEIFKAEVHETSSRWSTKSYKEEKLKFLFFIQVATEKF